MTSPLSSEPRTPPSPAAKPTINPHATPKSPQLIMSLFAKAALPVVGAMTRRRPCSFASMNSSTCGAFWSWCLAEPDFGQGLPGGVLTGEPHQQHVQRGSLAAAAVGAAPAGVAEAFTGCAAPLYTCADRSAVTAATLAVAGW